MYVDALQEVFWEGRLDFSHLGSEAMVAGKLKRTFSTIIATTTVCLL